VNYKQLACYEHCPGTFGYHRTKEKILEFTEGTKLRIAMDSNARSTTWYDMTTNPRGKLLEEFLASNQLHVINEESKRTNFQSIRGKSNIDITLTNNQMIADINNWQILEEESASDHNIMKFNIKFGNDNTKINNSHGLRYIIKGQQQTEFHENLYLIISKTFQIKNTEGRKGDIDEELNRELKVHTDIRKFTETPDEDIHTTCRETCKYTNAPNPKVNGRTVPWSTDAIKIMRKRTNALRRRYQRTTGDKALRERRRNHYIKAKKGYPTAIKREKTRSLKQYCTTTFPINPWNEVYKLATSKAQNRSMVETLQ